MRLRNECGWRESENFSGTPQPHSVYGQSDYDDTGIVLVNTDYERGHGGAYSAALRYLTVQYPKAISGPPLTEPSEFRPGTEWVRRSA